MKKLKVIIFIIILFLLYPLAISSADGIIVLVGDKTNSHEISFIYPMSLNFNNKVFQSTKIDWGVTVSNKIMLLSFWELSPRIELSLERITAVTTPEFTNSLPGNFYQNYSNYFRDTIFGVSLIFEKKVQDNLFCSLVCGITTTPVYPANFPEYYYNIDKSSELAAFLYTLKYIIPTLVMYKLGVEINYHINLIKYTAVKKQTIDLVLTVGSKVNNWFWNYYYKDAFCPCMNSYYARIGIAY